MNRNVYWLGGLIYYGVVLFGGLLLISYLLGSYPAWQDSIEYAKEIREIKKRDVSYYFWYNALIPTKEVFSIGENLTIYSDRSVKREVPLRFIDILYCDKYNHLGYVRIDEFISIQPDPLVGDLTTTAWTWNGKLPENPKGTPIPATCYIQATICTEDKDIEFCQTINSDKFRIE